MYGSDQTRLAIAQENAHRIPDAEAQAHLKALREALTAAAIAVDGLCPPGRARSLALTKLDEARMWACNAIVERGQIRELPPHDPIPVPSSTPASA